MTTATMTTNSIVSQSKGPVLVLTGIILTSMNLRAAVTSLSALFHQVAVDVPGFDISLMGILPLLCFAIFGFVAPWVKNKLGFEKALLVSMLMCGAGLALRAYTSSFAVFFTSTILALAGMAFGNVLLPPIFKKYFPNQTGAVTSLYAVMIAFSAGVPSVLSVQTVGIWGWRGAVGIWAVVGFASAVPWLLQCLIRPQLCQAPAATAAAGTKKSIPVYKWANTWGMALLFGVGGMLPMYTVINWLPSFLIEKGMSLETAGFCLFLYNTVGLFHSFIVPLVIGKMKHPFSLVILAFVLQIVGYLGFMFAVDWSMFWCVVTAPGLLTIPATFQLFNLRSRTPEGATSLSSFVQFIGYIFAAVGPYFFGLLKDMTGGWNTPWIFLCVMSVVMFVAGGLAMRNQYLEDAQ